MLNDVRVKICGITSPMDAIRCDALGADFLGVVFAESPRRVSLERARQIRAAVPHAKLVGVFADAELAAIVAAIRLVPLDVVQLHGRETPEFCEALAAAADTPLIKGCRPGDVEAPEDLGAHFGVDFFLLDFDKGGFEPSPSSFSSHWNAAASWGRAGLRIFLAGSLTPSNVREAVQIAEPYGVDVSRGVESAPGSKDLPAVERFIAEAKACTKDR